MLVKRISELLEPLYGEKKGTCVICGCETGKGHDIDFSDNFTSWSLLCYGNCICEYCYALVKNQDFRRKSWYLNKDGVTFFKRDKVLDILQNPPEPPFAMYITQTRKKQGFLQIVSKVNYSKKEYYIAFDDLLVLVNVEELKEMIGTAKKARELKFAKKELRGDIKVKHWEHRELCEKIMGFVGNPLWEVVVYAV